MDLETKRTARERSSLDEMFALATERKGIAPACLLVQGIIASLLVTRWLAAFGKN